jgi:hypothetical protein
MEKRKIQRDAESGNEILTYMQKVGKNDFYQRIPKNVTHPKKLPNRKKKSTETTNRKLRSEIE